MVRQYSATLLIQTPLLGIDAQEFAHVTLHDWLQLPATSMLRSARAHGCLTCRCPSLMFRSSMFKMSPGTV